MKLEEKAKEIFAEIQEGKFSVAAHLWKKHTTGLTPAKIIELRDHIKTMELKISRGVDDITEGETGEL